MAAVDPRINDHMTRVQIRLLRQRLNDERDQISSASSTSSATPRRHIPAADQTVALEQAMFRRQELIDKINSEKGRGVDFKRHMTEDHGRPRSYAEARERLTPPPSRRADSQPNFRRKYDDFPPVINHPPQGVVGWPPQNEGVFPGGSPRHVIEHQFKPARLDPMDNAPRPQYYQPQPQPVIIQSPAMDNRAPPTNTKADMYEMMMIQNAQTHQFITQQMMISTLPQQRNITVTPRLELESDYDDLKSDHRRERRERPPSVHHHHYTPPPPQQQPMPSYPSYTLPPIQVPPPMPQYYSPRHYDLEPLKQPRARRPKTPKAKPRVVTPPPPPKPKVVYPALPFPGPWALRKFRHAAFAAYFSRIVKNAVKKPTHQRDNLKGRGLNKDFLFGIRLKEAVAALHHIYLNPEKRINGILQQVIAENARDLTTCFDDSGQEKTRALEDLAVIIENVVYEITEIMPTSGVLGTHRKAVVYDMVQNNKLYPRGYFWQIEKDLMTQDSTGRNTVVSDYEAFIMLAGMFLGRALVTTLMLKPVEYGLSPTAVHYVGDRNLKLLATLFVYLCRKVYVPGNSKNIPPAPYEIGRYLYQDDEMQPTFKKLKKSFDYSEQLLRDWGSEYVKRLKAARAFSVTKNE